VAQALKISLYDWYSYLSSAKIKASLPDTIAYFIWSGTILQQSATPKADSFENIFKRSATIINYDHIIIDNNYNNNNDSFL